MPKDDGLYPNRNYNLNFSREILGETSVSQVEQQALQLPGDPGPPGSP